MQRQTNRWRMVTLMLVCAAFFAALVIFQSAAAIEQRQEPIPLQPPFAFQADASVSANGYVPLPSNATRLLTETFGSGFNPSVGVTGTTTAWRVFTDTGSIATSYWARVIPALSSVYADTAWAPCGQCDGSNLDPDVDNYPANVGTWLIYGPVDLRDYYAAEVTFSYRLDANGVDDFLFVGASDDGTNFTGFKPLLSPSTWQSGTLYLGDHTGKQSVYIGFYFRSNGDGNTARGAFIDNVSLRAAPFLKTYMPSVARNYSVATPIPPFLYNYTFPVGGENDPDFVAWGQSYSSGSNPIIYEQGLAGGNPGNGMYLYNTQIDRVSMAGPNLSVSGNYEISVDFNAFKGKNNARYGIVFGASTNTFGRASGNRPTFNSDADYYVFALQFPNASGNDPADYQLERCSGNGLDCVKIVDRTTIPAGANADGVWDTLTVRRIGSSFELLVNGFPLPPPPADSNYTGAREFGMLIRSASVNGSTSPLEIDFDNYRVTQLP